MKKTLVAAALLAGFGCTLAKIPPPVLDDAAKLKAAEAAARTAWQGKVDSWLLCRAQDRVVAMYRKTAAKPMETKPAAPDAKASMPAAAASKPAAMPTTAAKPASMPATAGAPGTAGTPVALTAAPAGTAAPCADPGPFAFNPPSQTPLETSGAHSPAGTAKSPPSVRAESATMTPAKKP